MHGVIHISDWWPTFAALAGCDPVDSSGPTPLDGVDQSQYIMGGSGTRRLPFRPFLSNREKIDFVYLIATMPGRHSGDQVHKVKKNAAPPF